MRGCACSMGSAPCPACTSSLLGIASTQRLPAGVQLTSALPGGSWTLITIGSRICEGM